MEKKDSIVEKNRQQTNKQTNKQTNILCLTIFTNHDQCEFANICQNEGFLF